MNWITWLNTGVGIVGIVVGIIGLKNICYAKRIVNKFTASDNATIQQATVIHNGLDGYEVVKLSEETTKSIIKEVVEELKTEIAGKQLRIRYGTDLPEEGLKDGEVFLIPEE